MSKHFYRVIVSIKDDDSDDCMSLCFDFPDYMAAGYFAEAAYMSCDLHEVIIKVLEDEIDTTNSPFWRKEE